MLNVLELACELIARPSLTPNDAGCQILLSRILEPLGFKIEHLRFGEVDNLWARIGNTTPLLVFAGHTDVVSPGPLDAWKNPPFTPTIQDGYLYGRGAADMKGGLAAMITACQTFLKTAALPHGSVAFLITSDEEGEAQNGTTKVASLLQSRHEKIDYCLVGEPSTHQVLGDTIRIGRRGSLSGNLVLFGKQGHVALPEKADNPIHKSLDFLKALISIDWGPSPSPFPPTIFQIANIHAGTGAHNVIPGELTVSFSCRFAPHLTAEMVQHKITTLLEEHHLAYRLNWLNPSHPYLTKPNQFTKIVTEAIQHQLGRSPELSTGGGTSDGRFIAAMGAEVLELGLCNATIHQANERVLVEELFALEKLYLEILRTYHTLGV